jgi:hypothetical protein
LKCAYVGDCRVEALLVMLRLEEVRLDHDAGLTFFEVLPQSVCRESFHEPESVWIARYGTGEALDVGG